MSDKPNFISKLRASIFFSALLLGGFALFAAAILGTGDSGTRDVIKLRLEEDLKNSISQVVPDQVYDNDLLKQTMTIPGPNGKPLTIYQGTKDGKVSAVVYTVSQFGYSGEILVIMAVNTDGELLGVRVLAHTETPGLGDKIEAAKDDWILQFAGLSLSEPPSSQWGVKKDGGYFDEFSGATITPRAVVKAVKMGLEFFEEQKAQLLKPVSIEQKDENNGD